MSDNQERPDTALDLETAVDLELFPSLNYSRRHLTENLTTYLSKPSDKNASLFNEAMVSHVMAFSEFSQEQITPELISSQSPEIVGRIIDDLLRDEEKSRVDAWNKVLDEFDPNLEDLRLAYIRELEFKWKPDDEPEKIIEELATQMYVTHGTRLGQDAETISNMAMVEKKRARLKLFRAIGKEAIRATSYVGVLIGTYELIKR